MGIVVIVRDDGHNVRGGSYDDKNVYDRNPREE